jgi:hypothetical protein
MTRVRLLVVLVLAALSTGAASWSATRTSSPPHVERPTAGATAPLPLTVVGGEQPEAVITWIEGANVARWYEGVAAAEEAERMEAARRAQLQPRAPARTGSSFEGVGDCTGFAIPDHIIQRESGGNPYAVNPSSGAFGCAQVMPFHWAPGGACAGLDPYSIEDQRTCVDWLSQGGTRLSPWAATR